MSQTLPFKITNWWCLSVLGSLMEFFLESALKNCHAIKDIKKFTVCHNLHHAHLLEGGPTKIPEDHETLSIVRHVRLHVDFEGLKVLKCP